jgi:hypothetical protein
MDATLAHRTGQSLVPAELFDRLTARIAKEQDTPREFAARIVDQTLAFLRACGEPAAGPLAPSELVDIGWHTFILYTTEYAEFCQRVVGHFVHHLPNDDGQGEGDPMSAITRTRDAIQALGFELDTELWLAVNVVCSSGDDGCRASGKDGNENTDSNGK